MSFNGDGTRFAGDDGFMKKAVFGAEVIGDASTPLPAGIYMVTAVAAVSTLPAPADGGDEISAGYCIEVDGSASITPAIGDDLVTLTVTNMCDISSIAMDFSNEEIDVTTLCDKVKIYLRGKADMAGALTGVFIAGISDATDGLMREFIDIIKQDGDASYDVFVKENEVLLGLFFINNDSNKADLMKVIAPFQTYGHKIGAPQGEKQGFDSSFRFAPKSFTPAISGVTVSMKPAFYRLGDGS